jgi:hypothetical protein
MRIVWALVAAEAARSSGEGAAPAQQAASNTGLLLD